MSEQEIVAVPCGVCGKPCKTHQWFDDTGEKVMHDFCNPKYFPPAPTNKETGTTKPQGGR